MLGWDGAPGSIRWARLLHDVSTDMGWPRRADAGGAFFRPRPENGARCAAMRPLLEHRPEEAALVADDAPRVLRVAECGLAGRIGLRAFAVALVVGEAGEREHRERDVARAFGWQEVAVMRAAELLDERNPHLPVGFEFDEFVRIDDVAEEAGDHGRSRCCDGAASLERGAVRVNGVRAGPRSRPLDALLARATIGASRRSPRRAHGIETHRTRHFRQPRYRGIFTTFFLAMATGALLDFGHLHHGAWPCRYPGTRSPNAPLPRRLSRAPIG